MSNTNIEEKDEKEEEEATRLRSFILLKEADTFLNKARHDLYTTKSGVLNDLLLYFKEHPEELQALIGRDMDDSEGGYEGVERIELEEDDINETTK